MMLLLTSGPRLKIGMDELFFDAGVREIEFKG